MGNDMIIVPRKEYRALIEENTEALTTLDILTDLVLTAKSTYLDIDQLELILGIPKEAHL